MPPCSERHSAPCEHGDLSAIAEVIFPFSDWGLGNSSSVVKEKAAVDYSKRQENKGVAAEEKKDNFLRVKMGLLLDWCLYLWVSGEKGTFMQNVRREIQPLF